MTDIENHMVIGNEETDRDIMMDSIKRKEDRDLVNAGADKILSGGHIYASCWSNSKQHFIEISFGFEEVLQHTYEYTSDPRHPELHDYKDCAKEILELYPDSKLAKLIKHMAVVVAADALDIEI